MKLYLFASAIGTACSFQAPLQKQFHRGYPLFESVVEEDPSAFVVDVAATVAKTELLEVSKSLNEQYGCILIDSSAQEELKEAVEKLEMASETPTDTSGLIGDWTLLCSTASATLEKGPVGKIAGIDTSKLPFFNEGPLKEIRDTLNKSVKVKQLIKAENSDGIDRVDHVIDYMPPSTVSEFLKGVPDAIKSLNINPLQVSDSKFILVHKAEVESVVPVIKTKLSLESVVLNVAGKSQNLDPEGADVLGINVPFGEFLNAGTFETTYMDDDIRISRSKTGIVDQLRVFVKAGPSAAAEVEEEDEEDAFVDEDEDMLEEDDGSAPSDVEGDI